MADLVLVPREPTDEMLDELGDTGYNTEAIRRRYKAMIASAPSQEGGWQPDWRSVYENVAHTNDGDQDIIGVTRETLRLAQSAIRQSQSRDAYHNYDAAERE